MNYWFTLNTQGKDRLISKDGSDKVRNNNSPAGSRKVIAICSVRSYKDFSQKGLGIPLFIINNLDTWTESQAALSDHPNLLVIISDFLQDRFLTKWERDRYLLQSDMDYLLQSSGSLLAVRVWIDAFLIRPTDKIAKGLRTNSLLTRLVIYNNGI